MLLCVPTRCSCYRLHTQHAHDTPSKPYLLPRHLADSDNIYAVQEGNLPTYHWQSGLLTFLFYLWQSGLRIFILFVFTSGSQFNCRDVISR